MSDRNIIYALTKEGRELEIVVYQELQCKALHLSGNAYPMLQAEADQQGLNTPQRDIRYWIVGGPWFSTWLEIEKLFDLGMYDPIVWVMTDSGEHHYPESGRPEGTPPIFEP